MKPGNWIRGVFSFILGLIVATTILIARPSSSASEADIYDRVSSLENRVTNIEKGLEAEAKRQQEERRRREQADRIR